MAKLIPRDYQVECVSAIYQYFIDHAEGNPLVALPTGTGKGYVIAMFLESIFSQWSGQKVIAATHVKKLIEQNYNQLIRLWPQAPAGINSAGLGQRDTMQRIIFAGVASIRKAAASFGHVDLFLIDEAHLVSPNDDTMYQFIIAELKKINPNMRVIGFTATPWRLGHGKLTDEGGLFTHICFDMTGVEAFNRLLADAYLMPLLPKRTKFQVDTDSLHIRGGEFIESEIQELMDKDEVTFEALKEAIEIGVSEDRKSWLVFASGIQHAINITNMLNTMGIEARCVHSKQSDEENDKNIKDFSEGKFKAIVNMNKLTTGIDIPQIDLIIMLRPTSSPVLWVQMLGRGTRPYFFEPEKYDLSTFEGRVASIMAGGKMNCRVLDFTGNSRRLGPINDPVIPRKKGDKKGQIPIKICARCDAYNHISARVCCDCGQEFIFENKLKSVAQSNELIRDDIPIVDTFEVETIMYQVHQKINTHETLKVSYYSKLSVAHEYILFEHGGGLTRKAANWWRNRAINKSLPVPVTSREALSRINELKPATHIRVWVNKKFPEIMSYCWDGTAFGTQQAAMYIPSSRAVAPPASPRPVSASSGEFDDDVPF